MAIKYFQKAIELNPSYTEAEKDWCELVYQQWVFRKSNSGMLINIFKNQSFCYESLF